MPLLPNADTPEMRKFVDVYKFHGVKQARPKTTSGKKKLLETKTMAAYAGPAQKEGLKEIHISK